MIKLLVIRSLLIQKNSVNLLIPAIKNTYTYFPGCVVLSISQFLLETDRTTMVKEKKNQINLNYKMLNLQ